MGIHKHSLKLQYFLEKMYYTCLQVRMFTRSTPVCFTPNARVQMRMFSLVRPKHGYAVNSQEFHAFAIAS